MAASSPARGAFSLAGRLPQCGQQVSAVTAARARDSTAVKQIWPGAEAGGRGGAGGEPGDHVVREEQRPGFLAGQGRRAPAQDAARAADGPLQVQERDFDQPSLLVEHGEFPGGAQVRVQEGGEQPDLGGFHAAAAGAGQHGEADQPRDRVRAGTGGRGRRRSCGGGRASRRSRAAGRARIRPSARKGPERDGLRAVLDAPQQVRAGAGEPEPAVHGEEAAVGEVELTRAERGSQAVCQGVLAVEVAADDGGPPPAGARVQQPDQPEQRFRAGRGGAELIGEQRVIEQFQGRAVDLGESPGRTRSRRGLRECRPAPRRPRTWPGPGPRRAVPGPLNRPGPSAPACRA